MERTNGHSLPKRPQQQTLPKNNQLSPTLRLTTLTLHLQSPLLCMFISQLKNTTLSNITTSIIMSSLVQPTYSWEECYSTQLSTLGQNHTPPNPKPKLHLLSKLSYHTPFNPKPKLSLLSKLSYPNKLNQSCPTPASSTISKPYRPQFLIKTTNLLNFICHSLFPIITYLHSLCFLPQLYLLSSVVLLPSPLHLTSPHTDLMARSDREIPTHGNPPPTSHAP